MRSGQSPAVTQLLDALRHKCFTLQHTFLLRFSFSRARAPSGLQGMVSLNRLVA